VGDDIRHGSKAIEVLSLNSEPVWPLLNQISGDELMERWNILSVEHFYEISIQAIVYEHLVASHCSSREVMIGVKCPFNRN
jgi:hypothetical protein